MKKRDLLFAGLLLIGATAFAQPQRTSQDAKEIFFQGFEGDFDEWSNEVVDSITVLQYYNNTKTGSQANVKIWEDKGSWDWNNVVERTDSVLYLRNGVMTTDDKTEIANHNYDKDKYYTLEETSQARKDAFAAFGEKGGDYVFEYVSDTCHYNGSQTYTPEYRRNLFVRGIPIEDTTSYRLTFYVKATKVKDGADPRMYVDLMRGYFHAEKRFSMGLEDDANNFKYKAEYYLEKHGWGEATDDNPDPFLGTGEWEKVTMMSYYTNDSIANSFVFINGYWWNDDWVWSKKSKEPVPTDNNLLYIVQPDKFFVRLSFSSDDTKFQVDNISLTKSTIGGVEYSGGKLRVDFGYKTNLADLAKAAEAVNKIDAVEVKNDDNKYFTVWGLMGSTWVQVPIASAEYHGDGYMYMFTQEDNNGNPLSFNQYDSVLVTFHNPVDQPSLALKYVGDGKQPNNGYKPFDHVFPRAWDTTWVKAGKIVPDFYNEVGKKNPFAVQGVYSMKELPPVVQGTEFEDNSFGLPSNTSSIYLKFSRKIDFDDKGSESTKLIATLGNEILTPSWETTNETGTGSGVLTLTRTSNAPLSGDKELKLIQLKGIGTPEAAPVTFHYHFGGYTRVDPWTMKSDWRGEINITAEDGFWRRPIPASLYYWYEPEGFFKGTGDNQYWTNDDGDQKRTSLGLYKMNDHVEFGDCWFYLSGGGKNLPGNLYTIVHLAAGNYTFSFPAYGWGSVDRSVTTVEVYPAPAEIHTRESLDTLAGKTEIGRITRTNYSRAYSGDEAAKYENGGYDNKNLDWGDNTNIFEFPLTIAAEGDYVIEWETTSNSSQSYYGIALGNYTISEKVSDELWFVPTNNLNKSVKVAQAVAAKADATPELYGGADLTALKDKIAEDQIDGTFTSTKPSDWAAEKTALDKLISDFNGRMAEVDKMKAANDSIASLVAVWANEAENVMIDYAAAVAGADKYASVDYTVLTLDSIKKSSDALNALIKNFNDFRAKYAEFNTALADAAKFVADNDKYASLAELKAIAQAVTDYSEFNAIAATKDTLDKVVAKFSSLNSAFSGKLNTKTIYDLQVKALAELISDLDTEVELPEELEDLDVLVDNKTELYMLYAKEALYIAFADNLFEDTIDVSASLLTNGPLYTTAVKGQVGSKGELKGFDTEFFPGWKFTYTKGNPYIGGGYYWFNEGNEIASASVPVRDAYTTIDWNSGFKLDQVIEGLPAGNYTVAAGYAIAASANDGHVIVYNLPDSVVLVDSVLNGTNTTARGAIETPNQFADFETLGEGVIISFNPSCGNNGWGSFDNVCLYLNGPAEDFDYNEAIGEVEDEIADKMTNVAPVKAAKAAKYYNLNGVEQTAPKAGLNIKVVDGVATKVFVK